MKNAGKFMCKVIALTSLASLFLMTTCTEIPDHCKGGIGNSALLLPGQFCFGARAYNLCGGNSYNPFTQACIAEREVGVLCEDNHPVSIGTLCGSHTLTITVAPPDGGSVGGAESGETYDADRDVALFANANPDFSFVRWTGADTSSREDLNVRMTRSKSVIAVFRPIANSLYTTVFPSNGGSVTHVPELELYPNNATVEITATPNDGFTFVRWEGAQVADNNNPATTVVMNGGQTLVAIFAPIVYRLTTNTTPTEGGAVFVNGTALAGAEEEDVGKIIEIFARPEDGFEFVRWSSSPSVLFVDAGSATTLFTMPADNVTITAAFQRSSGGGVVNHVNFFCPTGCLQRSDILRPSHCYATYAECITAGEVDTLPPPCTPGDNCPTDLGSCTVGGICTNDIARGNCTGTFAFGGTCTVTPSPTGDTIKVEAESLREPVVNCPGDGSIEPVSNPCISSHGTLGWIVEGTTVSYDVNVAQAGIYSMVLRLGSGEPTPSREVGVAVNGVNVGQVSFFGTADDWNTFVDVLLDVNVNLNAGSSMIEISFLMPSINFDYFLLIRVEGDVTPPPTCTPGTDCPTDLGSCTVGGTCTNNVQRQNCAGTFVFNNSCPTVVNPPPDGDSFTDGRDGQTYRYVTIGTQTWMAENLNFAGTAGSTIGVCYNNNASNCDLYGRLYRWVEAMNIDRQYQTSLWGGSDVGHRGICPSGWHLPSDDEWSTLVSFVGTNAGTKLKSQTGWYDEDEWYIPGTDDFGFSALPGGDGWSGGFSNVGLVGGWWSASEGDAGNARYRGMYYDGESVYSGWYDKYYEFSVRCVMD